MSGELVERLTELAQDAADAARDPVAASELAEVLTRLRGPVRLAIAGRVKAGKSTLLNAIIGEELAPTDAGECTRLVTWYLHSTRPYVLLHPHQGPPEERPWSRGAAGLDIDLGGRDLAAIEKLEVGWPTSRLDRLVLIDTPGIGSVSTDVSARSHAVLAADAGREPVADAVLYLLRHTHASDLRFLEAFHDDEIAHGTPVNAIGVLSRADEIGASRLDALTVASRIAARYEADPRLRRLCPMVVPVAGLLAHAAVTLREQEYLALAALARAPAPATAEILLTADRLSKRESAGIVPASERSRLLDRLGLFGVRMAVELIRTGAATTSTALCAQLADISGLDRLRGVVLAQFHSRSQILKARSAVKALERLLRSEAGADGAMLRRRLEELTSAAHEFEEIRVLLDLRAGEIGLSPSRESELDRLLGGAGDDAATRLGLEPDATPAQVRAAARLALTRWQGVARHPLSSRATQIGAGAATRTIEGMLAADAT